MTTHVVQTNFHVVDPLDSTGVRCRDASGPYATSGGRYPGVTCSRRYDHEQHGSHVHRHVFVGENSEMRDLFWTHEEDA